MLTDDEIDNIDQSMCGERECHIPFAHAIIAAHEAKLREGVEVQEEVACQWLLHGEMVNAFNHPISEDFDHDGFWAEKGYSKAPLFTLDQLQAYGDARALAAREWQPIETAPKDFVSVIDLFAGGDRVTDCMWGKPEYSAKGEYDWVCPTYVNGFGYENERVKNPTHWMPLPAEPAMKRDEA